MKKHKLQFLLSILLFIAVQARADIAGIDTVKSEEKVVLLTDRSLYIVGEKLHFFAAILNGVDLNKPLKSQILYCELITPGGKKITSSKFLVQMSSLEGCITIPKDLLTGTYYLKAYTKLMRNVGPGSYGYSQIRIINPGNSEILATENNQNINAEQIFQAEAGEMKDMLLLSVDKPVYTSRDTISISILPNTKVTTGIKNLCLSVVPENTKSPPMLIQTVSDIANITTDYYPETRGLSISGKLTDGSANVPVKGQKVNLSIIGEGSDFMAARTDSSGRFYFALPGYSGSRDLFVCAEHTALKNIKIWVDNDFCNTLFHLPSLPFALTDRERLVIHNMALNQQIRSNFYSDSAFEKQVKKYEDLAFYGKPNAVIYPDNYIQLPTLEEYLNELPSLVKVRKHNGEPYFNVIGSHGLSFYDPLVMVDWVAVDEPSKILAISPQNISLIEIVSEDYIKGGQSYGGIISIISKKGDFAGIDLPSAGIFVNYRFLAEYECGDKVSDSIAAHPDVRNTLLWNAGFDLKPGQAEKFVCTAPDTPGMYNVVVEGIGTKGEIFSTTIAFEVKN